MKSHWDLQASQWDNIGAPLRPSPWDIQILWSWIEKILRPSTEPFNVLLLGATPELVAMPWPQHTNLLAIDANVSMIKKLSFHPLKSVGNWLQLPVANSCIHLVIGDGCYSMMAQKEYDILSNEINRLLQPGGHFLMRFFVRPKEKESIEQIQNDFLLKKIDNFHSLKWRIAMALQASLEEGVCLNDIWNTWNTPFKNQTKSLPWSTKTMETINVYKNNPTFYTFPTLPEISLKLSYHFKLQDLCIPNYSLGERCPIIRMQSKG